ncbi:MAG TPA: lytic transglycosylase domain-containing protein [Candidatus Limnocylindria bacterium]|nr:lytic transglycosylase domain-containing protein [Candidatus Limnocylindria bacterium]
MILGTAAPALADDPPRGTQTARGGRGAPSGARDDLRSVARQCAVEAGIDPNIFEAQIDKESGFNPGAYNPSGATGIAQIVPRWHPNVDPSDPIASLQYAANLMADHLARYGGDYRLALAAYNAGPGAVQQHGGVPPYTETQNYVAKILSAAAGSPHLRPENTVACAVGFDPAEMVALSSEQTGWSAALTAASGAVLTP